MSYQAILKHAAAGVMAVAMMAAPAAMQAQGSNTVLKPADLQKLLPEKVYYKGQSAPTQLRNSGGVKFADGSYVLATLVDTSGYATDVASKYQAYFVSETAIKIGGKGLPAGVYGVGFVAGNKFVVTDIGGHDVLTVSSATDAELKRPTPLQVIAAAGGGYRLYAGRSYVVIGR